MLPFFGAEVHAHRDSCEVAFKRLLSFTQHVPSRLLDPIKVRLRLRLLSLFNVSTTASEEEVVVINLDLALLHLELDAHGKSK